MLKRRGRIACLWLLSAAVVLSSFVPAGVSAAAGFAGSSVSAGGDKRALADWAEVARRIAGLRQETRVAPLSAAQLRQAVPGKLLWTYKEGEGALTPETVAAIEARTGGDFRLHGPNGAGIGWLEFAETVPVVDMIRIVSRDPHVARIEPAYRVRAATFAPNDPLYPSQWALPAIGVPDVWESVYCEDRPELQVTIAVLDTGVQADHPDLLGKLVPGYDALTDSEGLPTDGNGHGTHVAGIAAAVADNDEGIAGVAGLADCVKVMPVKVLDDSGEGNYVDVAEGIAWAVDQGADVLNLSLAGDENAPDSDAVREAIMYALSRGVVVVAAAGNDSNRYGPSEPGDLDNEGPSSMPVAPVAFPARVLGVIAVGAAGLVNNQWIPADFSNGGPQLTLSAPGVGILSTYNQDLDGDGSPELYASKSGTSMATPFVSGVAALLLAKMNAAQDLFEVRDIRRVQSIWSRLAETATDIADNGPDIDTGYGLVNTVSALNTPWILIEEVSDNPVVREKQLRLTVRRADGTIASDVYGEGELSVFNSVNGSGSIGSFPVTFEEGQANISLSYSSFDAGFYSVGAFLNGAVSGIYVMVVPPFPPEAEPDPGTYSSPLQVQLTSNTPDATIYYTLDGSDPSFDSTIYSGPISINEPTTIKAFAWKNGVASEIRSFTYTIASPTPSVTPTPTPTPTSSATPTPSAIPTSTPSSGGSGGGSGGSVVLAPVVSPASTPLREVVTESGSRPVLRVSYTEEQIRKLVENASDWIVLEALRGNSDPTSIGSVQVEFPASLLAGSVNKPVEIRTDGAVVRLKAGAVASEAGANGQKVIIRLERLDRSDSDGRPAVPQPDRFALLSDFWNLTLTVDGKRVSAFKKPVQVSLSGLNEATANGDSGLVAAYVFNEAEGRWEYVGEARVENGRWTFDTNHFSRFAVMAYVGSFEDMQLHWAERAVHRLAARLVVDGVDAARFAPDRTVTRAEFVAMLVRLLGLPPVGRDTVAKFEDVDPSAWYADAVARAAAAGLIDGVSPGRFAPGEPLTREQMAVIVARAYAAVAGGAATGNGASGAGSNGSSPAAGFADAADIAPWALQAVGQLKDWKLADGYPDGRFAPKQLLTRAEAAVMLDRLADR